MTLYLLRHGKTAGNLKKRYIGVTDEPLCEEGIRELAELRESRSIKTVSRLFVSPLLRCRETAELLFPGVGMEVIPGFRECDFGEFENRNYLELADHPGYQRWIDSGGTLCFPGGEDPARFKERCILAFHQVEEHLKREHCETAALVVHGGTIMSIMEQAALPGGSYYSFQVQNGHGYVLTEAEGKNGFYHYRCLP